MESIDKKTVVSSFVWRTLERIFTQGANLIVQIVLARILLPSDFGSLAIIVAITNYAALFVQSGLSTALIQKKDMDQLDISTVFTASLAVAFLMYLIIFFISPFIARSYNLPDLLWTLRVLALVLFLNAINSVQTAIFSRRMQFKKMLIRSLISVPVAGAIGIAMALKGFGIWALVTQNLVNMLLTVIVMSFGLGYKLNLIFSKERAKIVYSFGGKILLTNIINGLLDSIRTMTIGKKYITDDLAYYDKAYTYSYYVTQIVNSSISSVLLPTFSRKQTQIGELKRMARKSVSLSSFIMFPVLLGAAAVSRPLFILLLTDKWENCIPLFAIFCILRLPDVIKSIDIQVYYAIGRSGIHLAYSIIICLTNIFVLFITTSISVMAIAIGATIVEMVSLIVVCIISSKVYGYSLQERALDIGKPLVNSILMALAVSSIQLFKFCDLFTIIIQVVVGIVFYTVISYASKDQSLKEIIGLLKNIKTRFGRRAQI